MKVLYETRKQHSPICYTVYQVRKSPYDSNCYDIYAKTILNGGERFKGYNLAFKTLESAIEYLNI
jgi:hypothetical protein